MIRTIQILSTYVAAMCIAAFTCSHAIAQNSAPVLFTPSDLQWGVQGTGNGQFDIPWGIALNGNGNVFVVDQENYRIQCFDDNGAFETQWGGQGSGSGLFNYPVGIAIDPNKNIYIIDEANSRVQKFDPTGNYLLQWGEWGTGDGQFKFPNVITTDEDGNVYVGDYATDRIQKFDGAGTFIHAWGSTGTGNGQFNHFGDIAISAEGYLYASDFANDRIQKFSLSGTYLDQWGASGSGAGQFDGPLGLALDESENVYVADYRNHRIQKFSASGTYIDEWSARGSSGTSLSSPWGIAIDGQDNLYVTESGLNQVSRFATRLSAVADVDGTAEEWEAPAIHAYDADGDPPKWSLAIAPLNGTASISGTGSTPTTFDYAPNPGYSGEDTFTIEVNDDNGGIDQITVEVRVGSGSAIAADLRDDFAVMDTNPDGALTLAESGLTESVFDTLDLDGNQLLTIEELLEISVGSTGTAAEVWLDFNYVGTETGTTSAQPFNSLLEASAFAADNAVIYIAPGDTTETIVLDKPLTLMRDGANGSVRIAVGS